jgi:hypothetical protein
LHLENSMKIKAKWGFIGDAEKLKAESSRVKAGQVFEDVDDEYAHTLIGKGLVEEFDGDSKPKGRKAAAPKSGGSAASSENKAAAPTGGTAPAGQSAAPATGGSATGDAGGSNPADPTGNPAGGVE